MSTENRAPEPRLRTIVCVCLQMDNKETNLQQSAMQSLICPCPLAEFWAKLWDQRPLLITRRANEGYFGGLFTLSDVETLLQQQPMRYCWNVDVTRYAEVPAQKRCNGTDHEGTD